MRMLKDIKCILNATHPLRLSDTMAYSRYVLKRATLSIRVPAEMLHFLAGTLMDKVAVLSTLKTNKLLCILFSHNFYMINKASLQ